MLILARNTKETLMIGDDVRIKVLGVKGNHVRLGIDAPSDLAVHREEVYLRIQNECTAQGLQAQLVELTGKTEIIYKRRHT